MYQFRLHQTTISQFVLEVNKAISLNLETFTYEHLTRKENGKTQIFRQKNVGSLTTDGAVDDKHKGMMQHFDTACFIIASPFLVSCYLHLLITITSFYVGYFLLCLALENERLSLLKPRFLPKLHNQAQLFQQIRKCHFQLQKVITSIKRNIKRPYSQKTLDNLEYQASTKRLI